MHFTTLQPLLGCFLTESENLIGLNLLLNGQHRPLVVIKLVDVDAHPFGIAKQKQKEKVLCSGVQYWRNQLSQTTAL